MSLTRTHLIIFFLFFLIIFLSSSLVESFRSKLTFCQAKDRNYYLVRNRADRKKAADLLARVNRRVKFFLKYLRKKHYNNRDILRLYRNYNEHQISEADRWSENTSYSVNKGEKIVLCLRHRHRDREEHFSDLNTIMFVVIHELAHLMSVSVGHTDEFWENMRFLLKEATECPRKIYQYVPYHREPVQYCGIMITNTPYKP